MLCWGEGWRGRTTQAGVQGFRMPRRQILLAPAVDAASDPTAILKHAPITGGGSPTSLRTDGEGPVLPEGPSSPSQQVPEQTS